MDKTQMITDMIISLAEKGMEKDTSAKEDEIFNAARQTKEVFDMMVKAGFTEQQAMSLITSMMASVLQK